MENLKSLSEANKIGFKENSQNFSGKMSEIVFDEAWMHPATSITESTKMEFMFSVEKKNIEDVVM